MGLLGLRIAAARPPKVSDGCVSDAVAGAAMSADLEGQHERDAGEKEVLHPVLMLAHAAAFLLPQQLDEGECMGGDRALSEKGIGLMGGYGRLWAHGERIEEQIEVIEAGMDC